MKHICYILLLLSVISCCRNDTELRLQKFSSVDWGDNCITGEDCFYLDADSALFSITMSYSYKNGNKQLVSTMDYNSMLYGSELYCFKSEKDNSYVVLWKMEHEFFPSFKVYYLKAGKLMEIGDWGIYTPCKDCDTFEYSVDDIRIQEKEGRIEFTFLKDMQYIDYRKQLFAGDWTSFKSGALTLFFNPKNGVLHPQKVKAS